MSFYNRIHGLLVPTSPNKDYLDKLPIGTYTVGISQQLGYYLQPVENFEIKFKVYGNPTRYADRILNTFSDRPNSTGVMLTGEKGAGKTMLTKMISILARQRGMSTIIVNQQFAGEPFNVFIQAISERCVVLFDEFEKVYDDIHQQALLTLLDGVSMTQKLFMITSNDTKMINSYMRNRPGRIFYVIEYGGLTSEFITEYCQDVLIAKHHIKTICRLASLFEAFNFDMLKALVEDMNRYNETPHEVLQILNAKPIFLSRTPHEITVFLKGKKIPKSKIHPPEWTFNPIAMPKIDIHLTTTGGRMGLYQLTPDHITDIDTETGIYKFIHGDHEFIFTKKSYTSHNYLDYIEDKKKPDEDDDDEDDDSPGEANVSRNFPPVRMG